MEGWENFFLGQVGAAAALGGLLFVAVSLNLSRILSDATLPDRALVALSLILAVFVMSSLMLLPGQSPLAIGLEAVFVGLAIGALGLRTALRTSAGRGGEGAGAGYAKSTVNWILFALAILPFPVGGIIAMAGDLRTGLFFVAAAIILSFVKAVLDAWVLLVEINR